MAVIAAGFVDFAISWRGDVFSGEPQSSSAAEFGTLAITFGARKATSDEEWQRALAGAHLRDRAASRQDIAAFEIDGVQQHVGTARQGR